MNDECVEEEDMSLDSDDGEPHTVSELSKRSQEVVKEKPPQPPPPEMEEFRPPLPDQQGTPDGTPTLSDYSALKTAISQFKASNQIGSSDIGSLSPGGFPVNPHQSFLCPSASWSSYTGSSSYAASPAYPASPCSSTQEQEHRPPSTAPATLPTPPVMAPAGPLANLASLPLEVKPPPPPHLMMLGHTYGSDTGGAGATGSSPHSDTAQPGFIPGIPASLSGGVPPAKDVGGTPTQHDRTLSGPGEGNWVTAGSSTCETVASGPADPTGIPNTRETLGGSTPGNQGGRTQVNCANKLGPSVGIPTVATRGGAILRPKLPPHPMCGVGYGIPGPMDYVPMRGAMGPGSLGHFRGRGMPPLGFWPRIGRGHDRGGGPGGGPCSWGFPAGRGGTHNYYSDYTYSHNYAPE